MGVDRLKSVDKDIICHALKIQNGGNQKHTIKNEYLEFSKID
jgi:hypothetical protein